MARDNGPGHNSVTEKPYFDRLVELFQKMEALRENIKVVCVEAREADIKVTHLKLAVRRHLETVSQRNARLEREEEAERILRVLGEFVNTPLGEAAMREAAHGDV